jgi:hypothetical protein
MRLEVSLENGRGAIRAYVVDNGADDHEWNGAHAHVRLHQSCALAFPDMPLELRETSSSMLRLLVHGARKFPNSFFIAFQIPVKNA